MEPAPPDAAPLALAGRTIRHVAAASGQGGGSHRGVEDTGSPAHATSDARSGALRFDADAHAPPQHLTHGLDCPDRTNVDQPQRLPATETIQRIRKGPLASYAP